MTTATILLTSAASLVGRAVLDALEGRRQALRIVGCSSLDGGPTLARLDACSLVPPTDHPDWEAALRRLVVLERPDVVIPGRDADVEALAALAERWEELGPLLMAGSSSMATVMGDKARSAEFARLRGLAFVPTVATDRSDAADAALALLAAHGFPLIAKPARGAGSLGVRVLTGHTHLAAALRRPGLVLQPFLEPPAALDLPEDGVPMFWEVPEDRLHAVQVLVGRDGARLGACAHRARMVLGRCEEVWACDDPALLALALAFADAFADEGWRGPLNVQAKRGADGDWQVVELNGRFSGGTSSRRHLGFDEVGILLESWLGRPVVPPTTAPAVRHVVRMLSDFPVQDA
jgi:hypothetical protein